MSTKGVLLVNLGSPDSPSTGDVRRYLREFLMDGRVMDAPYPIRFGVVHGCILPFRPRHSAEAYRSIWSSEGSPLVVTSRKVRDKLQPHTAVPIEVAMRYQNPSIESAVRSLVRQRVDQILVIPLFPHYAMSSYETAVERVKTVAGNLAPNVLLEVVPPFYQDPGYIAALVASAESHLAQDYDHLLFSFHGLPERHLRKADPTGCHCLVKADCCEKDGPAQATCYRSQCFKTVKAFVKRAGVPEGKYAIAFQSRLGRDPWLKPYTDQMLEHLAGNGVKKLLVICPAFVADCLETLEEIGLRGREAFLHAGGHEFTMIPCLNEHPLWIGFLQRLIDDFAGASARNIMSQSCSPGD
jgi:ferrochelatase